MQYPDSYENYRIVNSIRENMRLLGIPAKMRGYRYIFDAVMLAMHEGEMLYSLTKQLYPRLAKLNDTSVASVERAYALPSAVPGSAVIIRWLPRCSAIPSKRETIPPTVSSFPC